MNYGKSKQINYGERKCMVCGKIFIAMKPSTVTCSKDCWKKRRRQVHMDSYYKRKDWVGKLVEERDALLVENLELKKRLGIIQPADADKQSDLPAENPVSAADAQKQQPQGKGICLACGKEYKPTGSRQRFCSKDCRENFKKSVVGGDKCQPDA